jgi:photosystem II stability/assembly factor-like uncharacterized protein
MIRFNSLLRLFLTVTVLIYVFVFGDSVQSQSPSKLETAEQNIFESLKFRSIGPFRGGRSAAVAGVPDDPMLYYMGAAGGGVWKTEDAGATWSNISDGFFGGSIGAIAVAPSNKNVIYVGGGEVTVRGNVSHGSGMWKSVDAGKSWESIGLTDSQHIPRLRVHPTDPNTVFAAVLGHLYGSNQERGVFKSTDGGKSWNKVLFANEDAGAVDITFDPNNPRVLYASTWRIRRTPYSLESGGEGSGVWKSTDGGETWKEITANKGMPDGPIGISGVAVSPLDSDRVFVMIEAPEGGLFRSDDAGESWTRINSERTLRQRAWYYTRVYCSTSNIDEVYVLNVRFWRSGDGGKSFSSIRTPHGDHHDLWIAPENSKRMIIGDDGGGQVTNDGGENWSTYENQPTAQFYRVTTDNHFPYRIYGAQQDNSTVRILSRTSGRSIGERDWEPTAGGESGHIAPDPNDPDIVYGGSYGGYLTRYNHKTKERRNIHVWPDNPMGHGAGDGKYRFQWNFPIFFSQHDSKTLFAAANVLFKTNDGGESWEQISEDLTRNDPSKLGSSGGPITKDNTSVEYYCTIFAACESTIDEDTIWAGTDDGLLHVTRDGGKEWTDVTPPDLPEWSQINSIEAHPTEAGGLYVAATRYKLDDFRPYLYKTTDFGETWTEITNGIDSKHFTRVIRASGSREGLLFAGTESGLYVSFDDGENWKTFQCNVPIVPVTDLAIKDDDLIVATQGRSFWVLDDLSLLNQLTEEVAKSDLHLFETRPTYRMSGGGSPEVGRTSGQNVRAGVPIRFYLKEVPEEDVECSITITDDNGEVAKVFATKPDEDDPNQSKLELKEGLNEIRWNMSYPSAASFPGMVLWGGGTGGPRAVPGDFTAELKIGDEAAEVEFEIAKDPRSSSSVEDLQAQFDFLIEVREKLSEVHESIAKARDLRSQISAFKKRIADDDKYESLVESANELIKELTEVEEALYQTKNQSPQDPLNYPIKLNNRLSGVVGVVSTGDYRPTQQSIEVRDELVAEIDELLTKQNEVVEKGVKKFNSAVRKAKVPAIWVGE